MQESEATGEDAELNAIEFECADLASEEQAALEASDATHLRTRPCLPTADSPSCHPVGSRLSMSSSVSCTRGTPASNKGTVGGVCAAGVPTRSAQQTNTSLDAGVQSMCARDELEADGSAEVRFLRELRAAQTNATAKRRRVVLTPNQ